MLFLPGQARILSAVGRHIGEGAGAGPCRFGAQDGFGKPRFVTLGSWDICINNHRRQER